MLRMFVYSLLCVTIVSLYITEIYGKEEEREEDLMFGSRDQLRVSELGSTREENLNCFFQFDQYLADKWTTQLEVGSIQVISRLKEEEQVPDDELLAVDIRIRLNRLDVCMNNLTKKLENPGLKKCMRDLVNSEIENDGFISLPELFDNTLPLPFLTFLDIRELAKVLYQNRTWEELNNDEKMVFQKASDYLKKDKSGRDKVFIFDQACEWKNLAALMKREKNHEELFKEFKQQVIRSLSQQVANGFFTIGDLKPGTWINVYRRWAPVRLQNLKELQSLLNDLKTQKFTIKELCGYATTLGTFFAEQELAKLIPEKISPLRLIVEDIKDKSQMKEESLCRQGVTKDCEIYRRLIKSYEDDLSCVKSFGELLSNHILYSIIEKFANIEPRITYPEVVCKRRSSSDQISIRYCRCAGSFCTFRNVGQIKANYYKLTNGVVTKA